MFAAKRDAMFAKLRALSVTPPVFKQQQALNKPKENKVSFTLFALVFSPLIDWVAAP